MTSTSRRSSSRGSTRRATHCAPCVTERALYTDSSALVKLVVEEREPPAPAAAVEGRELVASEFVLPEVPRAIRRLAADAPAPKRSSLQRGVERVLGALAL